MALTNQGATRSERLGQIAAEAVGSGATPSQGPAFIDDGTSTTSHMDDGVTKGSVVLGDGGDERYDYYPDPGDPQGGSKSANVVHRTASVQQGQAGTQPSPTNAAGFPGLP